MTVTDLSPRAQLILSYYVAGPAGDLSIATRFYPYNELVLVLDDKMAIATRKFGVRAGPDTKAAGTAFLDRLIADGAYSTEKNKFGGTMHQFQAERYAQVLKAMREEDAIVQAAKDGGEGYWQDRFPAATA